MSNNRVNVLGTEYEIIIKKYDEKESFERRNIDAFCDVYAKKIVVCDIITRKEWEYESREAVQPYQNSLIRHEIVHAFLFESGLAQNSGDTSAWAINEEMVDWFAQQGMKIYAAWVEANAI